MAVWRYEIYLLVLIKYFTRSRFKNVSQIEQSRASDKAAF